MNTPVPVRSGQRPLSTPRILRLRDHLSRQRLAGRSLLPSLVQSGLTACDPSQSSPTHSSLFRTGRSSRQRASQSAPIAAAQWVVDPALKRTFSWLIARGRLCFEQALQRPLGMTGSAELLARDPAAKARSPALAFSGLVAGARPPPQAPPWPPRCGAPYTCGDTDEPVETEEFSRDLLGRTPGRQQRLALRHLAQQVVDVRLAHATDDQRGAHARACRSP